MTLRERITAQQREDLYNRRITTREMASQLGVSETHLSRTFPGKIPGQAQATRKEKRILLAVRNEFRDKLAAEVIAGRLDRRKAARTANCSERTMWRHIAHVRSLQHA
mgnify:CR=1 FL=1